MTPEEIQIEAEILFNQTMQEITAAHNELAEKMVKAGQLPHEWGIVSNFKDVVKSIQEGNPIRYEVKAVPKLTMTGENNG